jgi:hypothetical protein
MDYKIQSTKDGLTWRDWQVGTFKDGIQALEYVERTVDRYRNQYQEKGFKMRIVEVTEKEADEHNHLLEEICD